MNQGELCQIAKGEKMEKEKEKEKVLFASMNWWNEEFMVPVSINDRGPSYSGGAESKLK